MNCFSLYVSGPDVPGCTTPHIHHCFSLGMSCDGDLWPSIVFSNGNVNDFRTCNGRYRTPFIGGGGSLALFRGLRRVYAMMEKDQAMTHDGRQADLIGAYNPAYPKPARERHMDDRCGYLRLGVRSNGSIVLDLRPLASDNRESLLHCQVGISIPPTTPYQRTYAALIGLWADIGEDNLNLGGFTGNHA